MGDIESIDNAGGEKLISKRELLAKYGISYGALYRWKRKGLIPDAWFIRKSTPTGQETFFPYDLICDRINYILLSKDEASLDKLAESVNDKKFMASLIIDTKYGVKDYPLEHINKILIRYKERELDLTEIFRKLKNENEQSK